MTNIVETLKEIGLSYDIIGVVCGESYSVTCNYASGVGTIPESAIDKLKRLRVALESVDREDVASLFENHVLMVDFPGEGTAWTYLYELWANGIISDEELSDYLSGLGKEFGIAELAQEVSGEAAISLEAIPALWEASPTEYLGFRNHFVKSEV